MILDKLLVLEEDQTGADLTVGDVIAADVLDLGSTSPVQIGEGEEIFVVVQVTDDLTSAGTSATLQIVLATDTVITLASPTKLMTTEAIAEASLVAGYKRVFRIPPEILAERYLGIIYTTAVEDFTGGTISAWITKDLQTALGGWKNLAAVTGF
jgi:hypothetical protein